MISQSRHSRRREPSTLSQALFARGLRNGVRAILMPAAEKTVSKSELYFGSRSWIRTLIGIFSSSSSQATLRACCPHRTQGVQRDCDFGDEHSIDVGDFVRIDRNKLREGPSLDLRVYGVIAETPVSSRIPYCSLLEQTGRLRPGLSGKLAVDLVWAMAGPETYEHLVLDQGWNPEPVRDLARGCAGGPHPGRLAASGQGPCSRSSATPKDLAGL